MFYMVATLHDPDAEPFMVVASDPDEKGADGSVPATVVSLHWTEEEAVSAAQELTRKNLS